MAGGYRIHAIRRARRDTRTCGVFHRDPSPSTPTHDRPCVPHAVDRIRARVGTPELVRPGHDPIVVPRLRKVGDDIVER